MTALSISSLLALIVSVILISFILIFGKTKLHRIWALFNISVCIWGLGCFLAGKSSSSSFALKSWQLALSGGVFISTTFFHTVTIICNNKKRVWLGLFYSLDAIFVILVVLKPAIFFYAYHELFGSIYYYNANFNYFVALCGWIFIVILGLYDLLNFLNKATGAKRIQSVYFFFGTFIGFMGGLSVHLPFFNILIYPIGNFGVAIYAIIGTYAILRFRLLDIKVAITRTGIFIAVYTIVLGLPFAVAGWTKTWLSLAIGSGWWMVPLILMAFLATVGPFIYIYIERRAEDRLLREQRRYQNTLKHASMGMTRIRNLTRLLNLITHIVTKTVRISYVAIYLLDENTGDYELQVSRDKGRVSLPKLFFDSPLITQFKYRPDPLIYEEVKRKIEDSDTPEFFKELEESMRSLGAAVAIPSFLEDKFIGFIVLGDKISGQIYTPDDLNVFQVLASQAALAIENAQFYEEAKEMQSQISQAEKMATIGTMADGLSHQINNRFHALSLIAGDTIDTIKFTDTSKCTPEVKEMIGQISYALDRIQSNVLQGGEVVKGILKYSRKGEEGLEALSLDDILNGTLEMIQFKIKLADIDIIRNYTKDIPKIKGNMVQLQEVFFNFIDNAFDATVERKDLLKEPGYRGKITVSAVAKDNLIEIMVEDNGIGVKAEDLRKVFTPFFTTKISNRKGTGLGLYVIHKIITDAHKGRINFESVFKVGTRFMLQLPIFQ